MKEIITAIEACSSNGGNAWRVFAFSVTQRMGSQYSEK